MEQRDLAGQDKLRHSLPPRSIVLCLFICAMAIFAGCTSSGKSGGLDILGPADETAAAGAIVQQANEELTKIKVLYKKNEGKREEIKKAMAADDANAVRKIADDVVYLINDGADFGKTAVEKIQQAQEMNVNDDYKEYLRLKEEALKRQLEAFDNYREAARVLRDNYDPKNSALRDKVKAVFEERTENYKKIMEDARDFSNRANELAKETLRKQQQN